MKIYRYIYPGDHGEDVSVDITEDQIMAKYWDEYSARMGITRQQDLLTREYCIESFVVNYWAWEINKLCSNSSDENPQTPIEKIANIVSQEQQKVIMTLQKRHDRISKKASELLDKYSHGEMNLFGNYHDLYDFLMDL